MRVGGFVLTVCLLSKVPAAGVCGSPELCQVRDSIGPQVQLLQLAAEGKVAQAADLVDGQGQHLNVGCVLQDGHVIDAWVMQTGTRADTSFL